VAEVVEHMPSKCEALCSSPSTTKKKKKGKLPKYLTLLILATQETEIGQIEVRGQPGQKERSHLKPTGHDVCICQVSYVAGHKKNHSLIQDVGTNMRPYLKNNKK
jgi:hypothetical protein